MELLKYNRQKEKQNQTSDFLSDSLFDGNCVKIKIVVSGNKDLTII